MTVGVLRNSLESNTAGTSTKRRREDRRGDEAIDRALPVLERELSLRVTHGGSDYLSETPGGYRRLLDDAVDRLGTLIQHLFYFRELEAGALGRYHGRGKIEAGFRRGSPVRLEYVRAELECFPPGVSFEHRPEDRGALRFEFYFDRERNTWRDPDGSLLGASFRIWREDPDRDPERSFP